MANNSVKTDSMVVEPEQNKFPLIFMFISINVSFYCLYKANLRKVFLETCYFLIISTTILIILEFVKRFSYFFDDLVKINSEPEGNLMKIIETSFSFNNLSTTIIFLVIAAFLTLIINLHNGSTSFSFLECKEKYTFPAIAFFSALCFSYLLMDLIKINECRAQKLNDFYNLGGLDYGSSMACSYFYGYLKIILPPDGKEHTGLKGRIQNFEDKHNVSVPVKKLFILIPDSFYIPTDLGELSNNELEVIPKGLDYDVLQQNRAGVYKRHYKNTIYKIIPGGLGSGQKNTIHIVTEGATPMLTFFEVKQQSHRYSSTYREFQNEIRKSFCTTLQNLLNDNPDCRDLCELVYYEDYDAKGKKVDIAKILLQRIEKNLENE
ncbi:stimulator of interferon genes protein [Leptopilina heterotoma]|uniref:stimulator of interferon genes protein n=1 Tax=Leptopilina heterotoma TaxID=63436 RepID=UPI001CA9E45B|nr:stimulator of interferon genes protein [Leptopilina heterotoma]XP_043477151.1 stimulator of interferon genes protein [Leptopilina heterotoma]XP_043477152.1 stimulator of interferon genes protein [Leptopilina heterotoma]XP_043477153.1 stimulator of interferon genes protein [Leptopilina heterotoma]XP_043477154.1 stimulator of interferon genes protein [Leptopilina heterotoma]XP_043477156.1 stimulator of interferon genes protein [Leptopilina heterotoma]